MSGRRRSHLARAGRRTNLALLILLLGAFLTGWLAFAAATSVPARLTTVAHGLLGLGVLVLVPWKTVVVRRAPLLRLASLLLAGVIIICLAAGFVEVFVGYGIFAGLSPIQVHVGAAFVAVPLVAMHLRWHRRQTVRRVDLSRRNLLRTGGFALGIGAGYAALEGAGQVAGLASSRRIATGSHRLDAGEDPGDHLVPRPGTGGRDRPPGRHSRLTDPGVRPRRPGPNRSGPGWTAPAAGTPMPSGPACR